MDSFLTEGAGLEAILEHFVCLNLVKFNFSVMKWVYVNCWSCLEDLAVSRLPMEVLCIFESLLHCFAILSKFEDRREISIVLELTAMPKILSTV